MLEGCFGIVKVVAAFGGPRKILKPKGATLVGRNETDLKPDMNGFLNFDEMFALNIFNLDSQVAAKSFAVHLILLLISSYFNYLVTLSFGSFYVILRVLLAVFVPHFTSFVLTSQTCPVGQGPQRTRTYFCLSCMARHDSQFIPANPNQSLAIACISEQNVWFKWSKWISLYL